MTRILSYLSLILLFGACTKHNGSTPGGGNTPPPVAGSADLQLVTDGLVSPVALAEPPDSSHRLFIVDETGKIWIVGANGQKLANPFMDLSSRMVTLSPGYDERGLLGLAFHPQFKTNGKFYVFYTRPPRNSWNNTTTISEFKVSAADPNSADMSSERVILQSDHPYLNHNGGTIAFGPVDGYLYISIGDGGNGDDVGTGHVSDWYAANTGGNGQDIYANLMGNILRIDVNGTPYNIPSDNPFAGTAALPEIWAYGFRNPYRFSFDMGGNHQLLVGDEGQSLYEEVDNVTRGGNYGWNVKEGTHCFDTDNDLQQRSSCPSVDSAGHPLLDPVLELTNAANPAGGGVGIAIIGGYVYRGSAISSLQGKYIFGMLSQTGKADGQVYYSTPTATGMWTWSALGLKSFNPDLGTYLKGFGQDLRGELYLMTSGVEGPSGTSGKVYKMVAAQ